MFDGISSLGKSNDKELINKFPLSGTQPNQICDIDHKSELKKIRVSNINRLIVAHLNINSLRNKLPFLSEMIRGNIDILVITESKIDNSFPNAQFNIDGYSTPFRKDRDIHGGGVIIYVREDIPCRELKGHKPIDNIEGIFLELKLRKSNWLLFGGYNPCKINAPQFLNALGNNIDFYMPNYDNFLFLGDFNSELSETVMIDFCDTYNLKNMIKEPTCFKNLQNPSSIDVILTNRSRSFQHSKVIETGLSDHHKLTLTVLKTYFQKQAPKIIHYRDYKHFDENTFRTQLNECIDTIRKDELNYENLEKICLELLNRHAPLKEKAIRANHASFMTKTLSKAIMTRSRLKKKFVKDPTDNNKIIYNKHRNYCARLVKKEKRNYYNNLDMTKIIDNKKFWKNIKPLFSEKNINGKKITLLEGEEIISNDVEVAEILNIFFSNITDKVEIKKDQKLSYSSEKGDIFYHISTIVDKFQSHPSIIKIKQMIPENSAFQFHGVSEISMHQMISKLDNRKAAANDSLPTKFLVDYNDIIANPICSIYNNSIIESTFPSPLKLADITPVHKKNETTFKDNYRPVSLLPSVSKIFERNMADQISNYFENFFSPFLCGFRQGFGTQTCLAVMMEKWKMGLDKGKVAGALLTDLSKAFDCLNHDLLIAKLNTYGFDKNSLALLHSYLYKRQQRTKINNSYSSWSYINSGIPQGSILGPLLFNIYINDLFFFIDECDIANYADDNTPYAIDKNVENLLTTLEKNTDILIEWFYQNYLKLNADKCHLLVTKHDSNVQMKIKDEIIYGCESVKLLGVTIDNKLDFNEHVSKLCKKVNLKLHALARISHLMRPEKLRLILKAFIESQFGYCPLIWMFHSRTLNNRINKLHERALRLVYKDPTLSFEDLLKKDNSLTIHCRNLQKLAIEMYKRKNNLSPSIMKLIFPDNTNPYNLRNNNPFKCENVHTVYNGTETLSYRGPKTWALVPENIKQSKSLSEFKAKIKTWDPKGCTCRLCNTYISNLGFI